MIQLPKLRYVGWKNKILMKINIENLSIKILTIFFICFIVGFYPLALMYKEEYKITPITLEAAWISIFFGSIFNIGLFLSLTRFGLRWKKVTLVALFFSAVTSLSIFYFPSANPMSSLANEEWFYVRHWFSFSSIAFVLFIMVLVGLHKNEI